MSPTEPTHLRDGTSHWLAGARALLAASLVASCATQSPAAPPPPGPAPAPSPEPTVVDSPERPLPPAPSAGDPNCSGPPPGAGFVCVQDCGPPVAREGDPPPGFSWLSAEDAEKRQQFGCPICLPADARIATPRGSVPVSSLGVGDPLWTLDVGGRRVPGRVLHAASTPIRGPHALARIELADGRIVRGSPGHPTLTGAPLSALRVGDPLSGSVVTAVRRVPFSGRRTYDVLPSGPTGAYFADGVLLRSSFR